MATTATTTQINRKYNNINNHNQTKEGAAE